MVIYKLENKRQPEFISGSYIVVLFNTIMRFRNISKLWDGMTAKSYL